NFAETRLDIWKKYRRATNARITHIMFGNPAKGVGNAGAEFKINLVAGKGVAASIRIAGQKAYFGTVGKQRARGGLDSALPRIEMLCGDPAQLTLLEHFWGWDQIGIHVQHYKADRRVSLECIFSGGKISVDRLVCART